MELKTTLTQHVSAPAAKVWSVVTDIPGSPATLSAVESVQLITGSAYAEGTRWRETRTMLGRSETVEMWVSRCEPPSPGRAGTAGSTASTTVQARQGGTDYTSRFSLAARDGGTDLTLTFTAVPVRTTRLARAAVLLFGPLGMRLTRKGMARDLAEIAGKAEGL